MSKYIVPDCLVLKLEEVEHNSDNLDSTVYVFYDKRTHHFFLRGRRRWTEETQSCAYSFQCEFAKDLADLIEFIICKKNKVNVTLYNYDNLPFEPNDVTYDFLSEYNHSDYEIAGYDNIELSTNDLLINLRMLRNVFNYYN